VSGRILVLVSVQRLQDWSITFVTTHDNVRVGPWLLLDSVDEVNKLLAWGEPSLETMKEHENSIRRWGISGVEWWPTDRKLAQLIERGRGWP
jgi:hypothetical protein